LPILYDDYLERARVVDTFLTPPSADDIFLLAVETVGDWPFLVVVQHYSPSSEGFDPGVLIVPETSLLMIGAGQRLLVYDLEAPCRLWQDKTDPGFWHWERHGDLVVMAAELELAAWDIHGKKKWSTYVEPPWVYWVENGEVQLDIMGSMYAFPLEVGPQHHGER